MTDAAVTTVRVGVLGCGNVGGAARRARSRAQGDDDRGPHRPAPRGHPGRRARPRQGARRRHRPPALLTTRRRAPSSPTPTSTSWSRSSAASSRPASLILDALKAGKPVVTANKELLANVGAELFEAAEAAGRRPAVRGRGGRRHPDHPPAARVAGGRADHPGARHRQRHDQLHPHPHDRGRARATPTPWPRPRRWATPSADPTADVEGYDAGAKAAIIASIAFGAAVVAGDVYHEGITGITPERHRVRRPARLRHQAARRSPSRRPTGEIGVRVHPAMVPLAHPLAVGARGFNAVFVEGDAVGELMFYGRGAGGGPTASAVLGDLIDAARQPAARAPTRRSAGSARPRIRSIDDVGVGVLPRTSRWSTGPACSPRWPACSASTACRSARWSRRASATRPASSSSPTAPARPTCRPPSPTSRPSTRSARIGSVLRVVGDG